MVDAGGKFSGAGGRAVSSIEVVRDFIMQELHWDGHAAQLTDDYPLIKNHVVDSLGLLTLVSFLEERFGIKVLDEELVPENFSTLDAISMLIGRKRAAGS